MKICFWGDIASAIKGNTIGGGELQIALLTKALALAGHEVVVIDPHINEPFITTEGIKVSNVPNWNKGFRGIRFFWYRVPSLYKLFAQQKADYYYVRMRTYMHIIPYLAARKAKGKFVLALASDIDLLSLKKKYKFEYKANFNLYKYLTQWLPGDFIFGYLLKRADYLIQQHSGQFIGKRKVRGKTLIFPNIVDCESLPANKNPVQSYYIYAGSLTIVKGADKLYELVCNTGNLCSFRIVGQPNDKKAIAIFEKLKELKNVDVKGRLKHSDTVQLIANAKALINTSENEGFPNVFLEAWAMGVPVLSLKVNPGNIIEKHSLGRCFDNDLPKMGEYIVKNEIVECNREKLASYVKEFHDFSTAADRFINSLNNAK